MFTVEHVEREHMCTLTGGDQLAPQLPQARPCRHPHTRTLVACVLWHMRELWGTCYMPGVLLVILNL